MRFYYRVGADIDPDIQVIRMTETQDKLDSLIDITPGPEPSEDWAKVPYQEEIESDLPGTFLDAEVDPNLPAVKIHKEPVTKSWLQPVAIGIVIALPIYGFTILPHEHWFQWVVWGTFSVLILALKGPENWNMNDEGGVDL
jgi:hypothetical protein